MPTTADVLIRLIGESTGLRRELKTSSGDVQKFSRDVERSTQRLGAFGNVVQGVFQGIGQAIFNSMANGVRRSIGYIDEAINKASDLNETIARTNSVYGENAREVVAWSQTTSRALGVSQEAALSATGSLGNMFKQLGFTGGDAAQFSRTLVEASADIVAFHNVSEGVPSVLNDIASAFRGEYDPIQKYIPLINAATVEQQALAQTGKESAKQLTAGEKAAAAYTIILNSMGAASGAAAREIESAASQQRIFTARMEEGAARIGQVFLPVRQAFFRGLNELLDVVAPYGEGIMDSLAAGLARGIVAILPVLQQLRALFTYWLKPGSPPRLLKELTDWGAGAMQAYLDGWTSADFNALREAGGMIERVVRSFAGSGDIAETDLVQRIFGTQRGMVQAINDMRTLGFVSETTLSNITDAAGPAGREVAQLVQEYFDLQRATQRVTDAQSELNAITDRYAQALNPLDEQLNALRRRQQEIRDNQRLKELGEIIRDPRAAADERQLARLEAEEIQLERQARAIESERDAAVDAAQEKLAAAKREEDAQRAKYTAAQEALEQQTRVNALIEEEANLRERLANEALAKQEQALRELERAQREAEETERERLAELERIADAQLRYQLATTDTAGQLAIMQAELGKVAEGSAEYYDILTQIAGLEETLQKQRDSAPGDLFAPIVEAATGGGDLVQASEGIQALSAALEQAFAALSGADGQEVQLAPAWQNFADMLGNIKDAAGDVLPVLQDLIDFVLGRGGSDPTSTADILRPTYSGGMFGAIFTTVTTAITNLRRLANGEWSEVWAEFRTVAERELKKKIEEGDEPGAFMWEQMIEIGDFVTALAEGDWKKAWELFAEPPREAIQGIIDKIKELLGLKDALDSFPLPWGGGSWRGGGDEPGGGGGGGGGGFGLNSFPGITPSTPLAPAMAAANNNTSNTFFINQTIGTNGDFGGARQGAAEGIRAALLDRRLSGA